MFYVYLHRKKTTGEVFYVGKGTGNRISKETTRSDLWKRTAKKHGVIKEYHTVGLQEWYAFELERDLIAYYGRVIDKTGSLVNILDGHYYDSDKEYTTSSLTDMKNYTFKNIVSDEYFHGNRHKFRDKFRIDKNQCDRLFCANFCVVKDWIVIDRVEDEESLDKIIKYYKREMSRQDDHTIYSFYNVHTEETIRTTRRQFVELGHCNRYGIHSLFSPSVKSCNRYKSLHGWVVLEFSDEQTIKLVKTNGAGVGNPAGDKNLYNFINYKTKEVFYGTRLMFKEEYGISLNTLFYKTSNRKMTSSNWFVPELLTEVELDKINYLNGNGISGKYSATGDKTRYCFYNVINKESFQGTRWDLKMEYGIDVRALFREDKVLAVKGWCLFENLNKVLDLSRYKRYN